EYILDAVPAIRDIIGEDNAMEGSAVSTQVATVSTVKEIAVIASIAVIFVLLVLLLTTSSWAEPFIILIGLGVAILINMGSNIIFGEISFVSNAAGAILQLAVSLDYAVFLLHRFEESRNSFSDPREAMVDALCKSANSILSSGLTTVIGFAALCLMRFRIGPDLGLVLAKGVAISLICVFVFMPNFILVVHKLTDKTHHRRFVPEFDRFGRFVSRVMIPLACVFAVIIAPAFLASNSNDYYYGSSHIFDESTKLGADTALIEDVFGKSDTYVLMIPNGDNETQKELSDTLKTLPQVRNIVSYVDTVGSEIPKEYLDEKTLSMLVSDNYSRMVLSLDIDYEGEDTFELVEEIRSTADDFYRDKYYLAGNGVSTYDLMNTVTSDMMKVNLLAIGAVFVVLLITMKSISLPVILVLSIETAIWLNLSFPYFTDNTIFYIAYLIISSIQLGATVDYAILMTDRYMEYRRKMPKKQAVVQTISSCSVSILTSGSVLTVVGFLLGFISSHGLLAQLGIFLGRGTLCSLGIVMFVVPGLLYIFDRLIQKTTKNTDFYSER
ncbi:MAG: RND family transporter, partial [Ruminococcus sp.]